MRRARSPLRQSLHPDPFEARGALHQLPRGVTKWQEVVHDQNPDAAEEAEKDIPAGFPGVGGGLVVRTCVLGQAGTTIASYPNQVLSRAGHRGSMAPAVAQIAGSAHGD